MTQALNYFNYFTEIEDLFVRLRGKHVFISPLDWVLIEQWKTKGIPLYVALRGIETSFASHAASRNRRAVKTLVYCQEEVEAQYGEWMESQVGAATTNGSETETETATATAKAADLPFPREVILEHLRSGLQAIHALAQTPDAQSPALIEALERVVERLDTISNDFAAAAAPNAEALEDNLTEIERVLHQGLLTGLPAEQVATARKSAEAQLKEYKGRMDSATYDQTRESLVLKRLLAQHKLPRLSLFYL
jgi:hypothetical protein